MTLVTEAIVEHAAARRSPGGTPPAFAPRGPAAQRVTLVATSPNHRGGTERVVYLLTAALRRRGITADILIPTGDEDTEAAEATKASYVAGGIPARTDHRFSRSHVGFRNVRSLRSVFRPMGVGTVNIHYSTTTGVSLTDVLAARLAGKRCVLSLHHPVPLRETSFRKRQAVAQALRMADAVVVTTEYTRAQLMADLPAPPPITVIPLGIPTPLANEPAIDGELRRAAARRTLGLSPDAFVVGHLARLVRYKGLFQVIEALARPTDGIRKPHLVVAGDGPDRRELEDLAKRLLGDRAIFLGDIPDPDLLYAASDVFAMPSSMEGFGLVYVEAALHGVPSIATPAGGVPYVIRDDETGLLVPQEAGAIAAAVHRLNADADLCRMMGARARQHALMRFSDAVMAEAYCDVLFG